MSHTVSDVIETRACHVCGAPLPDPVLDLGFQPLCDDLVAVGDTRVTPRYPIEISLCHVCLTAHQRFNLPKETLFPPHYHYRPRFTQDVLRAMADLVEANAQAFGSLREKLVCDVGCNDGSLLNFFRDAGARTCGIEPTDAALEAAAAGHAIVHDFLSTASAARLVADIGHPDVVTFTNVFAHIQDLAEAIAAVRVLIKPDTIVVIENHYLGSVLSGRQFDTFYHEHPRTYSLRSFEFIARALGGVILSATFPRRYGGNIRIAIGGFEGAPSSAQPPMPNRLPDESEFPADFARMQRFVQQWSSRTGGSLNDLAASGTRVSGKSFPARASILISLLGIDADTHHAIYERPGSLKIGHYVPGTRIPIESDDRWMSEGDRVDGLVLWGWHIAPEIVAYLRAHGYRGRIFSPLPVFTEL